MFTTALVTSIAVYDGTSPGGGELVPGRAMKLAPHVDGPVGVGENPLKLAGAGPPVRRLTCAHSPLQKVAVAPTAA